MGFTILELMVVIVIMGMVIAMSIPAFSTYLRGSRLRTASREISSAIMSARTQAITLRRGRTVFFQHNERDFGIIEEIAVIGHVERWVLPPGVRFRDPAINAVKEIILTPMGRVEGAPSPIIIFSDENGNETWEANEAQRTITVGPLGHVTIE